MYLYIEFGVNVTFTSTLTFRINWRSFPYSDAPRGVGGRQDNIM